MIKLMISISLIVYFILLIILVLNIEEKSKIIKYSFFIFMFVLFVALFLINELVMDYLISVIIRYLYFPSFSAILGTIIATMVIFLYNIFNDKVDDKVRIVNYIFPSFIFVAYIIFMLLEVDINSYNALYDGDSLICIRYISRTFILWLISNILVRYYLHFLRKE